jgi:hypothetical protein
VKSLIFACWYRFAALAIESFPSAHDADSQLQEEIISPAKKSNAKTRTQQLSIFIGLTYKSC